MNTFSSFRNTVSVLVGSSVLAVGALTLSAPAQAGTLSCPSNVAAQGPSASTWSACQISDSNGQDFVNGGNANSANFTVNEDAFFGKTDWLLGGRTNFDPSPLSGSWSLPSLPSGITDVMMVFKGGQSNIVSYLLNPGTTGGTFTSPLFKPSNGNQQGVSHYTFYYRQGEATPPTPSGAVPEPTTMLGLAIAGGGLVAARRRKVANQEQDNA